MFKLIKQSNKFRTGIIKTQHGNIKTPFFMPDATKGFVKLISNEELLKAGVEAMVVNTLHLYLQPGIKLIRKAGGIHNFMNWQKPLLSDSGGFQVFSLVHRKPSLNNSDFNAGNKITDNGAIFKSPIDGSQHELTPEKSIQIQFNLGVDMMVCLDDCPPNNFSRQDLEKSVNRTINWAKRCKKEYEKQVKKRILANRPLLFSVIQGGTELDLRKRCIEELIKIGFDGYGFGAMPVDNEGKFLHNVLEFTADLIPKKTLRFALGIGMPENILQCARMGWDMFDCVIPTREGRHGRLFKMKNSILRSKASGLRSRSCFDGMDSAEDGQKSKTKNFLNKSDFYQVLNINNAKFTNDFSVINSESKILALQQYSKAYLRHLFKTKEQLGQKLISLNNLEFYSYLMKTIKTY